MHYFFEFMYVRDYISDWRLIRVIHKRTIHLINTYVRVDESVISPRPLDTIWIVILLNCDSFNTHMWTPQSVDCGLHMCVLNELFFYELLFHLVRARRTQTQTHTQTQTQTLGSDCRYKLSQSIFFFCIYLGPGAFKEFHCIIAWESGTFQYFSQKKNWNVSENPKPLYKNRTSNLLEDFAAIFTRYSRLKITCFPLITISDRIRSFSMEKVHWF